MVFETQDGYFFLERDTQTGGVKISDELGRQLLPQWLFDEIRKNSGAVEAEDFRKQYLQKLAAELAKLSQDPQNWMDRGVPVASGKIKIKNTSIPLKQVFWAIATVSLPAFVAISALVTGPAGLLLAGKAAAAVGPAFATLYKVIHTFSPTELDVHTAVAMALNRTATKILHGDGVTLQEVDESFAADPNLLKPRNLKSVLDDMAKKKMLIKSVAGDADYYKINQF